MIGKFTIVEILKVALQIEENGKSFYQQYSDLAESADIKKPFSTLAFAEGKHYEKFEKILESLKPDEKKEEFPGDSTLYFKALADESIFKEDNKPENILKKINSPKDAFGFALNYEFDAIKFYETMGKTIPGRDKKTVEEIISEEKEHVEILNGLVQRH